jgi:hypothetical protein
VPQGKLCSQVDLGLKPGTTTCWLLDVEAGTVSCLSYGVVSDTNLTRL